MITDQLILNYCNEALRPFGDRLAALLPGPKAYLDTVEGQALAERLGTTFEELTRVEAWDIPDYVALGAPQVIEGTDSGGRTAITNYDVIAILRVLVVLKQMMDANTQLGPLVQKFAVNPRI